MWYNKYFNNWVNIYFEHPLRTWRKVRKYFIKPKASIHFFKNPVYNCPLATFKNIAKIIEFRSCDVGWKDKYNTPRHEYSPYIWVCFFKTFGFSINWHIYYTNDSGIKSNGDMFYWEYLLDYLYYEKSLFKVAKWESFDSNYVVPIVQMSLNKRGLFEYKNGISQNKP